MDISSRMTPARLYRSRLDAAVQSLVALLGVIRCSLDPFLLGHGSGLCPKNLPPSEIEVSSVSCEQIRVALFFFITLCHPERVSGSHFIFSKGVLILFFITPRHPELDSGSHFIFSKIF